MGLDAKKVRGFRLTVDGGCIPELEIMALPPLEGDDMGDNWVAPLAAVSEELQDQAVTRQVPVPDNPTETPAWRPGGHITNVLRAGDVEQVWRGARGTGDMMQGQGALCIRAPGVAVEIVGTPAELQVLKGKLTEALEATSW